MYDSYPFELKPLPYDYNALEPFIDEKTMHLHHDKHLKGYVDKLNAALKDYPELHKLSLTQLLLRCDILPCKIKMDVLHNGGGVYNHNMYFDGLMSANQKQELVSNLMKTIVVQFGSFEDFRNKFKAAALSVFGSGYTFLTLDSCGRLQIKNTSNQEVILTCPIMLIDVWEHAYYLKNYNDRASYIDNWFNVVNWEMAENNYNWWARKK